MQNHSLSIRISGGEKDTTADRNSQRFPLALKVVMASGMYIPLTVGQLCRLTMSSLSEMSSIKSLPHS